MNRIMEVAAVAALIVGGAGAVAGRDFNGAEQIARGDYVAAEHVIAAQQKLFPRDPDLLLNLASVYAHTGRVADARRVYEMVTALPDEELDMAGQRTAWAHTIAAAGLKRLNTDVVAAR